MIRDPQAWTDWERQYRRETASDFFRNLRVFEALYAEAQALGVLPLHDPLAGIEAKIALAKNLNVPIPSPTNRTDV